jgi:hypothetical protein
MDRPNPPGRQRVAVIVPLRPGRLDAARDLLAKGPPFDPESIEGLDAPEVFLTVEEAVFVFESELGSDALAQLLARPGFWQGTGEWQQLIADPPQIAVEHYSWTQREQAAGLSFLPTPGPGDSDGGDIY